MKVAMIPVRSGSKRLPAKNNLPFGKNTILERCIQRAKDCEQFDRIIINTDDQSLSHIAETHSVEIYIRPIELASDHASSDQVVLDFLESFKPKSLYWVNTASPLSQVDDIKRVFQAFEKSDSRSVISVNSKSVHAVCANRPVNFNYADSAFARTQDLSPLMLYNYSLMGWKFEACNDLRKGVLFGSDTLMVETSILSSFLLKTESDYKFLLSLREAIEKKE